MRIVLDTNVIVSGLLSPYQAPGEVLRLLSSGKIQPCIDARILAEYIDVLGRPKFKFDQAMVAMLLDHIKHNGILTAAEPLLFELPDKDDKMFYEVAIAAKATSLVTGNAKHFPSSVCKKVKVLSPAQFIQRFKARRKASL